MVNKNKKKLIDYIKTPQALVVLLVTGLLLGSMLFQSGFIVSGYDGITAEITGIDSEGAIENYGASASVVQTDGGLFGPHPTGVIAEIDSAVDVHESESRDELVQRVDNGDGTDTLKYWDTYIVHCSMGMTITTSGGGLDAAYDITYRITLDENDFSIFTQYDENYAFILEVYTRNYTSIIGIVDVIPSSGGYAFPLQSVETDPLPDWIDGSGLNSASLSLLDKVSFDVIVEKIQPTSWLGIFTGASQAVLDIGIDVFLIGYWQETVEHGWEPPPVTRFDFFEWLNDVIDSSTEPLMMIALAIGGLAVIVLVVRFGGRKK